MKTFGEIIGNFFKSLISIIFFILKSVIWVAIIGIAFCAIVFILSIFFPTNVISAIEILKNILQIP
jgi:hypothetical protein